MKKLALWGLSAWTAATAWGDGGLIGFWDFKDGMDGAEVVTVSSRRGETTYTSDTAKKTNADGRVPTFSSKGPGRVAAARGGQELCADPWAIDFFYAARDTHQGGYIDLPGVADALARLPSYTIEYFIKLDKDFNYHDPAAFYTYISKTALYVQSGTSGYKLIAPLNRDTATGHPKGMGLESYTCKKAAGDSADYADDQWHHVAVVYTETNAVARSGHLALYLDGASMGTPLPHVNAPGTGNLKFRLGTGYLAGSQDKTATESIHASLACLRVTGTALTRDDFMRLDETPSIGGMDTAGFWDFKEGADGAAIAAAVNTVDPSLFPGRGVGTTQRVPTYSSERPGRYVCGGGQILAENPQSAFFGPGAYGAGGKLELASLASALTRLDAYTLEFFFKIDQPAFNNWRTLVGWRTGDRTALKVNLTGTESSGYTKATLEVLTNAVDSTALSGNARTAIVEQNFGEAWHHFAAVYTRADNALWIYIDKTKSANAAAVTNQLPLTQYPLVLGNSAFAFKEEQEVYGGYISCVRVTPRALEVDDFLTAGDQAVPPGTVFALNFDEGTADAPALASNTGTTSVRVHPGQTTCDVVYNLHAACRPRYAETEKKGRVLKWGETTMWTNNLCLWFPAASHLPEDAADAGYYGAMLNVPASDAAQRNPASWTMEAMVKLERTGLPSANVKQGLIFGKAGNGSPTDDTRHPRSSWLLSYNDTGHLVLEWTERPTAGYSDYAAGSAYAKKATTATTHLQDLAWHHVALSYCAAEKTFVLYVDGAAVLTQPLLGTEETNALYDGPYAYFFCRFPATGGFEGWMDEVRFTSRALAPTDFERYAPTGLALIFR